MEFWRDFMVTALMLFYLYLRIKNKHGSVTALKQWLNQTYVLEGGASNQVQRIIRQKFFLKSDINYIRQFFYQLNLNQSANVKLKSRKRCVFWIYFKCSDFFYKEFVPS
jgi:hypothetical protein